MNERIRELAELFKMNLYIDDYAQDCIHWDNVGEFAESIIIECAEFARQHNLEKADRSHMIHQAIKQHFGVKE